MRSIVLLALSASLALAQPGAQAPARPAPAPAPPPAPALAKIDPELVPEACLDLAKLADSQSRNQALSARISLARCMVDENVKPLVLCDCEQSVRELDEAMAPSFALLDEVFVVGDAANQIFARHMQAELLTSFATRMLATVPSAASANEAALRDVRLDMLKPMIMPWLSRAQVAYAEVDKIAKANPKLAKNPAVLAAVRTSRERLAQGVAKR